MPQPYNLTNLTGQTNLVGVMKASNDLASGLFGIMILLMTFILLFVAFRTTEPKKAFAAAMVITSFAAILLRLLSLITDIWMFGSFILAAVALIFLYWGD